jgi:hypothetical protein
VERGDYSKLERPFKRREFIGPDGDFVIAAPYYIVREAKRDEKMSWLVGKVINTPPIPPLENLILELFGKLGEPIPVVIPVEVSNSSGHLSQESGEGFIVPDGWRFTTTGHGPAINNMDEQRKRLETAGFAAIMRIFEPASASLLMQPLINREAGIITQHFEYQYHDAGHAAGKGLHWKLNHQLLLPYWNQGIEEWRADGVAFELAARTLPEEHAADLIKSNFVTRFGVDSHRGGGIDRDFDMVVALLTLDRLIRSGAVKVRGRQLALADPTPRGLRQAVELHRTEAVRLTRDELTLQHPSGLARLHAAFTVGPATLEIFNGLVVEPCRGLFNSLR